MLVLSSLILKLHIYLKSHRQQKVLQLAYQNRVKESARPLIWGTKLHLIVQHPPIGCSVLTTWRWLMALLVAGNFIQILIMSPWRMVQVSNCDHLSLFSMNSELGLQTANSREYVPQKAFQLGHQRDTLHISPSWSLRICLTNVTSIRRVTKTCPCRNGKPWKCKRMWLQSPFNLDIYIANRNDSRMEEFKNEIIIERRKV